ncbi:MULTISPECIES: rhodanese-like domain-containing protein [Micromonospora]|uniref:MBL fold metallo-hydrolase n=1 Tax=Micromonospora solifontis TaxID=2487138 RepID=A0ABX9WJ86_9ACTN|nr:MULTISPECIES: MBL fold metallo-hydrolase [Micromonospora]NES15998.1 MBL fold metallo-hydrolase [Micromonospora sp. PPF5-17B]NES36581.1 MBL fold metallo-hydrolase [Micromonospora solifontis]NES57331.1 MBL fold metallo-hydrolase [Micromonospora sp. PPF5-6]RNL99319.1 MBL fold metallo-hydrolase [Micromonospora solifontis]
MAVDVSVIATSSLGDRSYLASDGRVAIVVDPQRDIDRILYLAGAKGVRITHVVETHIHNDYVSGGLELARIAGARYLVAGADEVGFDRVPVTDGDVEPVSDALRLRVVATPGHTFHHLSYVLDEATDGDWQPAGVFTGGSLLFGTTGRTDLLGQEHAHELAHHQHASARRLVDLLPDGAQVWPTHGFGSFCSASQADAPDSTIGREKQANPVLRLAADEFVTQTLAGLDAYPAYYAHMGVANNAGPAPVDLTPVTRADAAQLRDRMAAGEWVVDLRHRKAYATSHLAGTVSLGLDGPMSTWLGWLIDWGTPITLLAETPEQVADAQRELVRIGIYRPAAQATGAAEQWTTEPGQLRELRMADFPALAAARAGNTPAGLPTPDVVLDVRMTNEWRAGHVEGAVHIPLPDLPKRLADVPAGAVWVHCGSGYRATAAASLLANAGREVVVVDDKFDQAEAAGVAMADNA